MEKDIVSSFRGLGISPEQAKDLVDLFETYEDIGDFFVTKQTFPVAIQLLRLILDHQIREKINQDDKDSFPPELNDLRLEIQNNTSPDGYQDIIISFDSLGFSIRVELVEQPHPLFNMESGAIANLIFTIPLVEVLQSGMNFDQIDQTLNRVLSKVDQELFGFIENNQPSTIALFHGLSTKNGFDFSMLSAEFIATVLKMKELANTFSDKLLPANPDSLFFYTI